MSAAEHSELAPKIIRAVRARLGELHCDLSARYSVSSKVVKAADRAFRAIDHLRGELDELVYRDDPRAADAACPSVYYDTTPPAASGTPWWSAAKGQP